MITPEQQRLMEQMGEELQGAGEAILMRHAADVRAAGLARVEIHYSIDGQGEEGSAPLSNDAEWLRSLRIAPDLEATDGS